MTNEVFDVARDLLEEFQSQQIPRYRAHTILRIQKEISNLKSKLLRIIYIRKQREADGSNELSPTPISAYWYFVGSIRLLQRVIEVYR